MAGDGWGRRRVLTPGAVPIRRLLISGVDIGVGHRARPGDRVRENYHCRHMTASLVGILTAGSACVSD